MSSLAQTSTFCSRLVRGSSSRSLGTSDPVRALPHSFYRSTQDLLNRSLPPVHSLRRISHGRRSSSAARPARREPRLEVALEAATESRLPRDRERPFQARQIPPLHRALLDRDQGPHRRRARARAAPPQPRGVAPRPLKFRFRVSRRRVRARIPRFGRQGA